MWWRILAKWHGLYYLLSGLWPCVAPESFQAITGRKIDFWLAQTVGALLAITGGLLLRAARRADFPADLAWIAGLQATVLAVVDVWCVTQPGTTHAYWLDAVLEVGLVLAWIRVCHSRSPGPDGP